MIELISRALIIVSTWIAVIADNINFVVTWVPATLWSTPNPNQVVKTMSVNESVSHYVIELQGSAWAFSTPPKPFASCFVERSPEYWDSSILESFQLPSNVVQVSNDQVVLVSAWSYTLVYIETCLFCVESACSLFTT